MDFPGERLLIKLWDTIADKGIGALLRPWQIRREGRANTDVRASELLVLAQAERVSEEIRQGRKVLLEDGRILARPEPVAKDQPERIGHVTPDSVVRATAASAIADSIRREVNVAEALLHAEAALAEDPQEPPEDSIADDWLYRWRDGAGSVSTEELQSLWGSVLAGEIKAPGSFSLRTLDFIRNLSQEEAKLIEKAAPFVIGDSIYDDKQFLDKQGITFGFLLEMADLGILSGVDVQGLSRTFSMWPQNDGSFAVTILSHDKALIARTNDSAKVITLQVYKLTGVGTQLFRLGKFQSNDEYLRIVGKVIKEQGYGVELASALRMSPTEVKLWDNEAL